MSRFFRYMPGFIKRHYIFNKNNWELNKYLSFIRSTEQCIDNYLLSKYNVSDFINNGITTYKLKNFNIGFGLKKDDKGVDIILIHNSSEELQNAHIMEYVMQYAIYLGGDHFDYYETDKLKHMWNKTGFHEYHRDKFDKKYAADNWDYDKYGEPDVVYVHKCYYGAGTTFTQYEIC